MSEPLIQPNTSEREAILEAALTRIMTFGNEAWDGPADLDDDVFVCQAHGMPDCEQTPQCIAAMALAQAEIVGTP